MFNNMTTDGLEESGDHLGGGGTLDTNGYDGIIKAAYVGKSSSSEAQSITALIDVNGFELRETFWISNKAGEHTYADKKDPSKKHGLPGFVMVDNLCLIAAGKPLAQMDTEEKTLNIYDYEAKKELPKSVPVLTALTDKPVSMVVFKQTVDKTKKNDSTGKYEPTGETREENTIDKFVEPASKRTVTEAKEGVETAVFYPKWIEKNQGKVRNKAKGVEGKSGSPSGSAPSASESKPATSLFGNS